MKKLISFAMVAICGVVIISSCNNQETYADQKKKENEAINAYIAEHNVKVISEETFAAQNYTTDTTKNEFVLFDSNGLYLQIRRKGCGEKIKANGAPCDVLVRFDERNLLTDSLQLSNNILYYTSLIEKMTVTNLSGTFTGSFDADNSMMYNAYGSQSVPSGWLYPLTYLNIGRPVEEDDEIAKIRVIVPSSQGQAYASQYVYPCLYDLTFQLAD